MKHNYKLTALHCIGRSVIKFPDEFVQANIIRGSFKPSVLPQGAAPFDVIVENNVMRMADFSSRVLQRSMELKDNYSETVDVLRLEKRLSDVATLFRIQEVEKSYRSELYFLFADSLVVVRLDSYGDKFLEAEERLVKFMADFHPLEQMTLSDPSNGFCLGRLLIKGDFSQEDGVFLWQDNAGNTFDIDIDTYKADDPKPLFKRMSGPDSLLNQFNVGHTVLRSQERTVAGMRAQEWLGWTNLGESGDEKTFGFALETMRPNGGKGTPSLHLSFDSAQPLANGAPTKTTLTDAEAVALWDSVVDSIRLRK